MDKSAEKSVLQKCARRNMPKKAMADSVFDNAEAEAKRKFDEWRAKYEPVAREIYAKRSQRAESKRRRAIARRKAFGDLCEVTEGLASFCRKNNVSLEEGERILNESRPGPYTAVFITTFFEIVWFGAVFLRKELTRLIDRAKHEAARPYYYEHERLRRQALAEERRKIHRRSTRNACPTREEILDAWKRVKESNESLLRFGSLLEDLECYVDNTLIRDDSGAIIGRRSGIKGWLQMEIPALYTVYSRVMAYKAAAKRMRQLIELRDPIPLSDVLDMGNKGDPAAAETQDYGADEILNDAADGGDESAERGEKRSAVGNITKGGAIGRDGTVIRDDVVTGGSVATGKDSDVIRGDVVTGGSVATGKDSDGIKGKIDEVALLRARAIYLEVIRPVGEGARRQSALIERMVKLTDSDSIEDCNMLAAWRAKYERKITVRTKSVWKQRLVKMLA